MSFDYEKIRSSFVLECPDNFNFAFDVLSKRAEEVDKIALISIDRNGDHLKDITYKELDTCSYVLEKIDLREMVNVYGETRYDDLMFVIKVK